MKALYDDFFAVYSLGMNLDDSPSSLEKLDSKIPRDFAEEVRSLGHVPDAGFLWFLYASLGSYFGKVLVKNLDGRWRYPSRSKTFLAWLLQRPDMLYRNWYVVVGSKEVPVFEIARLRGTLGRNEGSLVAAYNEIVRALSQLTG